MSSCVGARARTRHSGRLRARARAETKTPMRMTRATLAQQACVACVRANARPNARVFMFERVRTCVRRACLNAWCHGLVRDPASRHAQASAQPRTRFRADHAPLMLCEQRDRIHAFERQSNRRASAVNNGRRASAAHRHHGVVALPRAQVSDQRLLPVLGDLRHAPLTKVHIEKQ
eukprot:3004-Pleurochrysis_carterae.AAC.1